MENLFQKQSAKFVQNPSSFTKVMAKHILLCFFMPHSVVPSKRQVPKAIKLLEGIGNGGNGALIQSTMILWTNDQHCILLQSIGVSGKPSPVESLPIYMLCPCQHAPLYHPMLILACLTGVSSLIYVVGISLCTVEVPNTAQDMSDNLPSHPPQLRC